MKPQLLVVVVLFLARLVFAQAEMNAPSEFSFVSIYGSPVGQSYMSVIYQDGMLSKSISETFGPAKDQTIVATPTAAQWLAFRKALDEMGAWRWRNQYKGPSFARAGHSYRLTLKFSDRTINSSGANKEPESYPRFIAAMDKLFEK
jgi:hypothetical protein